MKRSSNELLPTPGSPLASTTRGPSEIASFSQRLRARSSAVRPTNGWMPAIPAEISHTPPDGAPTNVLVMAGVLTPQSEDFPRSHHHPLPQPATPDNRP